MRFAALDLGSNSFLCLICSVDSQKQLVFEKDILKVVRLGQGLGSSGKFMPEALVRAEEALAEFAHEIRNFDCEHVLAFATAAARDATNKKDLFDICKKYEIPVEIISGSQEAETTYQGAVCEIKGAPTLEINNTCFQLIIDIGGRSTELILGFRGTVVFSKSLDLGCVALTEEYFSAGRYEPFVQNKMSMAISATMMPILQELLLHVGGKEIQFIAVAGTPTTLASMQLGGQYSAEQVEGYVLTEEHLNSWSSHLIGLTPSEIQTRYNIDSKRADVIVAGVEILKQTNQSLSQLMNRKSNIIVSTKGIRYGVMKEMMKRFIVGK